MAGPCHQGSKSSAFRLFRSVIWQLNAGHIRECERLEPGNMLPAICISSLKMLVPRSFSSSIHTRVLSSSGSMSTYVASHSCAGDIHICLLVTTPRDPFRHQPRRFAARAPARRSVTHYYDVLGLNPKATQNQIKTAYYKMSKLHHPDVTECTKSHSLFTEINEAYEVLGNLRKRRMYDKGVYNPQDRRHHEAAGHEDEDYTQAYKNSNFERGNRPPPPTGRSRIYNFDEFYRQHYNDLRERRTNEFKEYVRYKEMYDQHSKQRGKEVPMPFVLGFFLVFLSFLSIKLFTPDYDSDSIQRARLNAARANNGRYDPHADIGDKK